MCVGLRETISFSAGQCGPVPASAGALTPTRPDPTPIDVDPAPVEAAPVAPAAGWPLVLYIDCRPVKGVSYIELHDHLQPAMRSIEATQKISHWDSAPYNGNQKLLAATLLLEPVKGHLVVNSKAPYANYCLDVLLGQATIVVRA